MTKPNQKRRQQKTQREAKEILTTFQGFKYPDANYIYSPNQFFDVCLPNYSSGVVRIVACMLYRTLGELDEDGNPIETDIEFSHTDLIRNAGVSKGCIPDAIKMAISEGFIICERKGRRSMKGRPAQPASYKLRWDEESNYTTDPKLFRGFFTGEGNCTKIPNAYFNQIVPCENLVMIKVVGTVLRYTVGFKNKYGVGRRTRADLPYDFIQKIAKIKHRPTLRNTLIGAMKRRYICVAKYGSFEDRRATSYSPYWQRKSTNKITTPKTELKISHHPKNRTKTTPRTEPGNHPENRTNIKTVKKDSLKQRQTPVVAVENQKAYERLIERGFDSETASRLAQLRTFEEIENQISWLPLRKPKKNPQGLLLRAIEGNWNEPPNPETEAKQKTGQQETQRDLEQKAEAAAVKKQEQEQTAMLAERKRQWNLLSDHYKSRFHNLTLRQITSHSARARIRKNYDLQNPAPEALAVMAANRESAGVTSS